MKSINVIKSVLTCSIVICLNSCNSNSVNNSDELITLENVALNEEYNSIDDLIVKSDVSFEKKEKIRLPQTSNDIYKSTLKIIKSANTRYKVKDIKQATDEIQNVVTVQGGYISEMRYLYDFDNKQNKFIIKIPHAQFDETIKSIEVMAESVDFLNISTKDVTDEYVDIKSRLKTKLEVKARYEEVLRKNTKTVKDILDTEMQLKELQEEIEVAQGRLNYLNSKVALSTIEVELYEIIKDKELEEVPSNKFIKEISTALQFGLSGIKNVILFFLYIWPLLVSGLIILFWWRKKTIKK